MKRPRVTPQKRSSAGTIKWKPSELCLFYVSCKNRRDPDRLANSSWWILSLQLLSQTRLSAAKTAPSVWRSPTQRGVGISGSRRPLVHLLRASPASPGCLAFRLAPAPGGVTVQTHLCVTSDP